MCPEAAKQALSFLEDAKDIATIVGVLIAGVSAIIGFREYFRQGRQKRAEQFIQLRDRYQAFAPLCAKLENEDRDDHAAEEIRKWDFEKKRDFLGFYEEVALVASSSLIRKDVCYYMFGYYAIRCWKSEAFWVGLDRESPYWGLFRSFAVEMMGLEESRSTDGPVRFNFGDFKL